MCYVLCIISSWLLGKKKIRQCRVPTNNQGRETALPSPLYYSGAVICFNLTSNPQGKKRRRQYRVPTNNQGRETALPSPLYCSGAAGIDINQHPIASAPNT